MIRTQVQFEEKQHERIRKLAHRERISFAEAVRRLVRQGLGDASAPDQSSPAEDLLSLAGIGRCEAPDLGVPHGRVVDLPQVEFALGALHLVAVDAHAESA